MYQRILLAYDGSAEGRTALREGALLARCCNAQVFLLSVVGGSPGVQLAEGAFAGAIDHEHQQLKVVFEEGVERLKQMGFSPVAKLVIGDPLVEIRSFCKEVRADLVVVGHRRRTFVERWWAGRSDAYLVDQIDCSLLIARNWIDDETFRTEMAAAAGHPRSVDRDG
ncbi:MAG: uncharacterized protein JWO72_1566 [Caulobacteraceae bacterium]|jgi:nucleotide-binding universal stress UspA family protein|nr:uncharacterized protein [Caulobacteraceae bacterium]